MSELRAFIRASDRVVEFCAYFSAIPQEEHTVYSLEVQKDEIVHLWNALRTIYDSLLRQLESEDAEVSLNTIQNKFYVAYDAHLKCLSKANELVDQLSTKSINLQPLANLEGPSIPTSNISLPPCDTDIFHGDYVSWPTFRDMFSALYKNNSRLTPVEKLYHLIKKTQNEARDIVKSCPLTNAGFEMAWKNLMDRYENKEVLLNAQLKTLFSLNPISKESGMNIKSLQRTINDTITNLSMLNINTESWDVLFVYLCSTCLPDTTLDLWKQHHNSSSDLPTWKQMDEFLTCRYQTLESFADIRSSKPSFSLAKYNTLGKAQISRDHKKINTFHTNIVSNKTTKCSLCSESHPIRLCQVFKKMSVEERFILVKKEKLCTNCLANSHDLKKCKSQYVCSLCKLRHHTLLHRASQPTTSNIQGNQIPQINSSNTTTSNPSTFKFNNPYAPNNPDDIPTTSSATTTRSRQSYSTHLQSASYSSMLLGTALVDLCVGKDKFTVRALIDPASEASFITTSLQKRFSLALKASQTKIIGLNGALTATASYVCPIAISSPIDGFFTAKVEAFVVRKLTGQLPYYSLLPSVKSKFSDLQMADLKQSKEAPIDLLLGSDLYPLILRKGVRWASDCNLVAQETVFGWIVTGTVAPLAQSQTVSAFFNEIELNQQLARFWELEEVHAVKELSEEDNFCEKLYQKTTYRNREGRFVVSLPFKKEPTTSNTLGYSRNNVSSQYLRNEARLLKQPEIKSNYDKVIMEYLTLRHMKKVYPDLSDNTGTTYYLPHHAVMKPDSPTTKLRVVFNASHPSSNGVSLNDILYSGPALQADLTTLILKWRMFRYVFNADIEKMYRQILVNEAHTPFQRILFRVSPDDDLKDYEMCTVTFGVNCAPYLAIRTLLELAKQCETESPIVAEILRNFMYVDDVLFGSHDLNQAVETRDDLIRILKTAGFSLRKWTANNELLLQDIPPEHLLDDEFLQLSESCTSKTLGLRWNAGTDHFFFNPVKHISERTCTKRAVLSEIAKLFDPAGWLAPKIVVAKLIMQQIWRDKTEWDDVIHPLTLKKWLKFVHDYPNIEKIRIPRFVNYDPSFSIELHGFCDASEQAYAATLYIRIEDSNGNVHTHLLVAKTKVAPIKFLTLPRKELCGAQLMATLYDKVRTNLKIVYHKGYMWTDSTIVLAWLQKPADHWKTFVANRVSSILHKTTKEVWFHVDSKDNPADLPSRGTTIVELISNDLWWHGPTWLKLPNLEWPINNVNLETQEELRQIRVHLTLVSDSDILCQFSDLARAMRVLCYVFRFFYTLSPKHKYRYDTNHISQSEMKQIKDRLVLLCQKLYFSEYNILSQGDQLPKQSSLLSLNPFIDSNGFMRVNGRLVQSPILTYDERFPRLLPYDGKFTRLYLELIHKTCIHGENALLLRLMRMEFWVPKLKILTKSIVRNCKECVLQKRLQSEQIMGALPPERTTLSRPFTHTGVDFAGPFEIKSYAGRGCKMSKGYVLVFVCFSTKAIHLEVTSEISTPAFMAAFARFFSRRGCPCVMYSDNGKAFVGAANSLDRNKTNFLSSVKQHLASQYVYQLIEWHFIPPGAPHMGGLWEAGVKSFKIHLKKVSRSQKFTFEEFSTMITRIEACLNSRPLCPMTDDPSDLSALTPGHFLIGAPLLAPAEPDCLEQSLSYANRWKKLKILHYQFALRWKEEYVKELHKRVKWQHPKRDFAVNDLVVVRRDNRPPNEWRLGRIERVTKGLDDKVRVCDVRTADGLITRPIVKLVLLPPTEQQ